MKFFNTLTKKKEPFTPLKDEEVSMYVCGITPYDTTHLGHAFTYMAFDVLQRYLNFKGYKVNYVQNVTDIDDDILKRAKQVNQDWRELGQFWTDKFLTDIKAMNMNIPTQYVKATETIDTIVEIVKVLMEKGYAYEKSGNVYFHVQKNRDYGKLSKYSREKMIRLSKERGANPDDPLKRDSLDFILWQKSMPREPFWDSPWSKGRPGWHIECSAMIYKYLYKYIDIHGGGTDLIFPHHESEIAQSEQFTGIKPFVKYWMHTGTVSYQGEKMSKSLGNLIMISDLLKTYTPNTIRYLLLSHHYREPWEFKKEQLKIAEKKMAFLQQAIDLDREDEKYNVNNISALEKSFLAAMNDDLNTSRALAILDSGINKKEYAGIKKLSNILGFTI